MRLLRTILKFAGAAVLYAGIVVGFWFGALLGAALVCFDQDWIEHRGWAMLVPAYLLMIFEPAILAAACMAQLVLWGVRRRVIPLRYRLGLDVLFGISYSVLARVVYDGIHPAGMAVLFLFAAVILCVGDLLMEAYVRWVDPDAVRRRWSALPPYTPSEVFNGPVPNSIRPAPRSER